MANNENPQIVRAMLRWKNLNMLSHYTHGFKAESLRLRALCWKSLFGSRIGSLILWAKPQPLQMIERNGRHEETRTPDLYRVNASRLRISRT